MAGKVWLVGAGPGDAGLLTIKGEKVLKEAEVVVYDSLVSDAILAIMPKQAEKIDAGKRAGNHTLCQDETNQILLDKALEGKRVVRLKGGDPFLFGRGGEELELLSENGIPYEIVPGVTSAIAVPAYNGIPVTHRDFTSSVHIITGHKKAGERYDIDFDALVRTKGTLIFLMGVRSLGDICENLINAGMDKQMPAAVLKSGTTAAQRRVVATVSTLKEKSEEAGIGMPAVIVIGRVAALADRFSWVEKLPLSGHKILLTRPKELISEMAARLRRLGAEVVELPAIATVPIDDNERLKKAFDEIESYKWIAFTSPSGVRIFFDELFKKGKDIRCLFNAKFAVLGEGTKKELKKYGLIADLMPNVYDGKSLGGALAKEAGADERILLARAAMGNKEILDELSGFWVDDVATYDTLYESASELKISDEIENGRIDAAVFTSSSSVKGFLQAYPDINTQKLNAICIGKQTFDTAKKAGMRCVMSDKATIDSLTECVVSFFTGGI